MDEQEVSKQFKKFVRLKQQAKNEKSSKMQKIKTVNDDFNEKSALDNIKRNPNESDKRLLARVNRMAHQRRVEAQYAAKYNVDIIRNEETGEIKLKKRPKDEIEELMKQKRLEAQKGFKKKKKNKFEEEPKEPKLTSLQKLKLKKLSKKQKKNEEQVKEFQEYQYEEIKFGETVHAPPTLVIPRKAAKNDTVPRPGQRDLLLSSIFNKEPASKKVQNKAIQNKAIDKKGKRKNLPNATRAALEKERENVVQLYRELKKKKPIVEIPNKNLKDF